MIMGFWEKIYKPILGLSPMDGVTDAPWRFIAKKYGNPDVIFTEFVSAEGLWRINKRKEEDHKIWKELRYDETERPVVAQLFGSDPEAFYESAKIICDLGFDGIDINMGCPSPGLEKRGGGAGLMRVPDLAKKIIEETRRGVDDWSQGNGKAHVPVSVKTRIGSERPDPEWWKFLSTMQLPVVSMHGRTFKQLYSGEADWKILKEAASVIRSEGTMFLANGDICKVTQEGGVLNIELSNDRKETTIDFDGVLIGQKSMGNPWIFRRDGYQPSVGERLTVALEHAQKYEEIFVGEKFFAMRKHLAWYARNFDESASMRRELVTTNNSLEVKNVIEKYLYKILPNEHAA